MIVAIDGMGGDNSPGAIVKGAVAAVNEYNVKCIITGNEELLKKELELYKYNKSNVEIINCTEVISPSEHPVMAIRKKKDSSLNVALNLVKSGKADAVVSAGSTGAFMAGALFIVGRLKGIDRPALAPVMPGMKGPFMIVDVGANVDCKPENLVQFANMGKVYFESILKISNPSVGLINIGSEEEKGNELTKKAYQLLKATDLNFVGNVEPREISNGEVQVLVCDGFIGNTVLKMYEGVAANIFDELKTQIMSSVRSKLGGLLLKPVFSYFKKKFDYKEYGGSAFIGVKGICVKAHGSSDATAIKNAIRLSLNFYENSIIEKIEKMVEKTVTITE